MDSNVFFAKSVAMASLFFSTLFLGTLPIKLSEWFHWRGGTKNHIIIRLLLNFAGGVLLCTTFLHLLPEVNENLAKIQASLPSMSRPFAIAEFLMCVGFFTMFFVEECVHFYIHKSQFRSMRNSIKISRTDIPECSIDFEPLMEDEETRSEHTHSITAVASLRGLLVVLALSIHELFEGLSVGLEPSALTVWYMFGAVSAHKLVIAFCIGVELVTSDGMSTMMIFVYVFVFAVVSPVGIGIGMIISEGATSNSGNVAIGPNVILQGLASGTLLYIVFFEILRRDQKSGLKQYFAIFTGFCVMTALTVIQND